MEQMAIMFDIFPQEHQREATSHHLDDKTAAHTSMKYHQRLMEQAEVPKRE